MSAVWNKLTSHIGLWISQLDRDQSQLRPSCSLSVLNQQKLHVVRSSKSSENLHRVSNGAATFSPQKKSRFTLRKSRSKNGKTMSPPPAARLKEAQPTTSGLTTTSTLSNGIDSSMVQSWHSNTSSTANHSQSSSSRPSSVLQYIFRSSRSRSIATNNNNATSPPKDPLSQPCCSSSVSTIDFAEKVPRRRRPRSAHFDPNTMVNMPTRDIPAAQDVDQLYKRLEKLGEGSYAMVYKSENRLDGSIVALKEIKLQEQEGLPFTAIREASLLRTLRHANIVKLHDILHSTNSLVFVFEYMKTDLSKYLEGYPHGLDLVHVELFLFQLLRGLAFCHERKILHRDLKPQNLLLSERGDLKLADFGLARAKSVPCRTFSHEVVTLWYRPPDVLLGSTDYSTSLDMWGVGCIFAEMCTGMPLFPGSKEVLDQLDRIFSIRGIPDSKKWPRCKDLPHYLPNVFPPYREIAWDNVHSDLSRLGNGKSLLSLFLQLNPDNRISASSAMMHPFFANLPSDVHILPPTASIFSIPLALEKSRV